MKSLFATTAYFEITKPRIIFLVLVTTAIGFYLAQEGTGFNASLFLYTLLGTTFTAAGAGALNSALEKDSDILMLRTQMRPVPQKIISQLLAVVFGITLTLSGVFILHYKVNLLTSFLSLLTVLLYALVYTPLKKITWLNTFIGSIPGAMPILMGWTAVTNHLSLEAWNLFLILLAWQHPHFYAIAWIYKEDYERGGFKMLPVVDKTGARTFFHVILYSILLILFSLGPFYLNLTGVKYAVGALLLGLGVLGYAVYFVKFPTKGAAKNLLKATLFYFPALFILIILDQN